MPSPVRIFCSTALRPMPHEPGILPSLGDTLLVDVARIPHQMELVAATLRAAPWCAVILVARQPLPVTELSRLVRLMPRHVATLVHGEEVNADVVHQAVRGRPKPTRHDATEYLRLRQLDRSLIAAVEDALALSTDTDADTDTDTDTDTAKMAQPRSPSAINRVLAQHSLLRAREWRALIHLLPILESAAPSMDQLAGNHEHDPRTLRALVSEHIGVDLAVALAHPGWEWKLEAGLRHHRLIHWPRPSRRSSAEQAVPAMAGWV
ncbi:MAG: hypothetical protein ABI587_07640 [Gemmatimonadales bacterium]